MVIRVLNAHELTGWEKTHCGNVMKGRGFRRAITAAIRSWALAPEGKPARSTPFQNYPKLCTALYEPNPFRRSASSSAIFRLPAREMG